MVDTNSRTASGDFDMKSDRPAKAKGIVDTNSRTASLDTIQDFDMNIEGPGSGRPQGVPVKFRKHEEHIDMR